MKKFYRFIIILSILSLIMIPLSVSGGKKKPGPPGPPGPEPEPCDGDVVTFVEVLNLSNTGFFFPEQGIVTWEGWCAFWDRLYALVMPKPECQMLIEEDEIAIYVALGQRPNSCYGVDITCITDKGNNELEVDYNEIVPGKGCICAQMIVTPVDVVKIGVEYENYDIEFQRHVLVHNCW